MNETNRDNIIDLMNENTRLRALLETANAYGAAENKARIEERELLAQMMIRQSLATGHGDTVADLVRELEPQIERLRAELSKHQESEFHPDWSMLEATRSSLREHQQMVRALRAEVAALKKDAERYVYIRDNHEVRGRAMEIVYGMNGAEWDAAIDAALGGEGS